MTISIQVAGSRWTAYDACEEKKNREEKYIEGNATYVESLQEVSPTASSPCGASKLL